MLASTHRGSTTAFNNRGVDFTNRAADINPEDIESLTVLKGPEAAALYGIDAANGAIVITTKRGRSGIGGFEYSNSFRIDKRGREARSAATCTARAPSADDSARSCTSARRTPPARTFYDNVDGFFQHRR